MQDARQPLIGDGERIEAARTMRWARGRAARCSRELRRPSTSSRPVPEPYLNSMPSACFINSVGDDSMSSHPRAREDRGHAVQVRARAPGSNLSSLRMLCASTSTVAARPRARCVGHARLRCVRRRDQERRQDAARRQDGDPERRPPGHRRLHRLQGDRGEEGVGADRCRLRRRLQRRRRRVRLGQLPEREPLGPRHRRVHERGAARRRAHHEVRDRRHA